MNGRFVIHIKAGAYFEYLDIARSKTMLMLVGDGLENTYIKGNRSVGGGWTTFQSGTVGEFNFEFSTVLLCKYYSNCCHFISLSWLIFISCRLSSLL